MSVKKAHRNLRLCTKDCLCLFVCPTGATDTENSIIDTEKCIGCGDCAAACPSGAISMMPQAIPPEREKKEAVRSAMRALVQAKADEEVLASSIAAATEKPGLKRLAAAIARSSRLSGEDLAREAGWMLPQGQGCIDLLEELVDNPPEGTFPKAAAEELLSLISREV